MTVSISEQQTIENVVAAASPDQRRVMRAEAEIALTQINQRLAERMLFLEENQAAKRAIEVLVRMDAVEAGKGWWFRFKRRFQLNQKYLVEPAPTPLSAIYEKVNSDAVKLMRLTDVALTKYLPMPEHALMAVLPEDFPSDCYGLDLDAVTFVYPNMSDFYFTLSENTGSKSLCITGRRHYAGFTLFVPDRGHWHCYAQEGIAHAATSARALAQFIEKKFGIRDMSAALANAA